MEHLFSLLKRYPESPFTLNALYLIGLNHLQERKSTDGKWRKEKDLDAAIAAFSESEIVFEKLYSNHLIPEDKIAYFITIRYRSMLENALVSLQLAEESTAKGVHLKNAEACLYRIYTEFETPEHPFSKYLVSGESLISLQEESAYHLARCYVLEGDDEAAARLLEKMLDKYQNAKITRGPYLSKVWYELGKVHSRRKNYILAIQHFRSAEDAAKGKVLRADELLDIWVELSQCHRFLGEMDEAMLILSQVINYDAVSPNRLKAMYLRALIYEEQGRLDLARRQLEAVAKKGGVWSAKAKDKLVESYVYK
jgi:tetratricopeptide (TPR) repeat protein